jgi:hypothetical protein
MAQCDKVYRNRKKLQKREADEEENGLGFNHNSKSNRKSVIYIPLNQGNTEFAK